MKICIIIDAWEPIWGGGQTHVWEISKRLAKKTNWELDIYTRALKDGSGRVFTQNKSHFNGRLNIYRIGPTTSFFNIFGRLTWLLTAFLAIFQSHKKEPYSLIHAHAYVGGVPGKILSMLLNIPVVFTVHGSNNLDIQKNSIAFYVEKFLLTQIKYNAEISVSKHFLSYSNVNKNIVVIPNGVDISQFDKIKKNSRRKVFRMLWIGRFDKIKGVDVLLFAFAKLLKSNKNCILNLVGYGYEEKRIKKLSKKLRLENNVNFLGKKKHSELVLIYKSCDLFVLPSLSEGQSIALLEAWASKLPVIATAVGDNAVFVEDGKDGFIIPVGDSDALYKSMVKAKKTKNLANMGIAGYEKVKKFYTWEKAVLKTKKIYEACISS